jgi:hypothetical protein
VQNIGSDGPRVHLDLHTDDIPGLVRRARRAGATDVPAGDVPVLRSPSGLIFCAVDHLGEASPPDPVRWGNGQSSRVDQVCFDIPPSGYDREVEFWDELTGWTRTDADRSDEFGRMTGVGALQVLLQRLSAEDPETRAHLDLACDGVPAEVERHRALGATHLHDGRGWVTLRDPTGLEYCVTSRQPH